MSSGIHTSQRFAMLDTTGGGINLDTYTHWQELAEQALYLHAVDARQDKRNPVTAVTVPQGSPDGAYCDAYLARLDAAAAAVRQRVIESWDPKRLRAPEVWPWHDEQSGAVIYLDKYYGFVDSGGLAGSFVGYDSAGDAIKAIDAKMEVPDSERDTYFSTNPEDLGGVACCILSGRQYVDRLYELCGPGGSGWDLSDYGKWHELDVAEKACFSVEVPLVGGVTAEEVLHALGSAMAEYTGTVMRPARPSVAALVNRAEVQSAKREKHASGLSAVQEAAIHKLLKPLLSKADQGRVMAAIRTVLS